MPADPDDGQATAEAALRVALCIPLERLIEHGVLELSGHGLTERHPAMAKIRGLPIRVVLMTSSEQVWMRLTPWAVGGAGGAARRGRRGTLDGAGRGRDHQALTVRPWP